MMRVSYNMITQQVLSGLMDSASKLSDAQVKSSTGKLINKPSDNPTGSAQIMNLNSSISQLDQMTKNSGLVNGQLGQTDSALSTISTAISQVRQLALQAANSSISDASRTSIAAQLDQISSQLASAGNTTYNGRYIFGGNQTQTPPIAQNTGGTPPYTYKGDDGIYSVSIAPGVAIAGNVTGDQVFNIGGSANSGGKDIFSTISDLKQQVLAGDVDAISKSVADVDVNLQNVTAIRAQVGARVDQITATSNQVANTKLNLQTVLSHTQDADLTQTVTDVQTLSNVYQAAIATAQKVFSVSLADYFK